MAEFKLGRIRFVWKDEWASGTTYVKDDVVKYGGRTYICQIGHVSDGDFYTDLEFVPTKWNQMTDGQEWKDEWSTDTFYSENDVVKYGGRLYICIDSHTSAATETLGLEANQADWQIFAEGLEWRNDWTTDTRYRVNDLIKYSGYTYVCNTAHTSAATETLGLEDDQGKWDIFNPGIEFKGDWDNNSVRYKLNDVVKYGAGLWICTTPHTSAGLFSDQETNWSQFVKGFEFEEEWDVSAVYQPGDIVRYGGNQYVSRTNHSAAVPSTSTTNWFLFTEGFNFVQDWTISSSYKISDVVRVNGYTYIATQDSTSLSLTVTASSASNNRFTLSDTTNIVVGMAIQFTGTTFGNVFPGATYFVKEVVNGSEITISTVSNGTVFVPTTDSGTMTATVAAHPTNATYWQTLSTGIFWKGEWQDDVEYEAGDSVRFGANAYICINKHRSEADDGSSVIATGGGADSSRPDQDIAGLYWNVLSIGSETSLLTTRGDLVYYSDVGPTRLPVGIEGQVLRVSDESIPEWVTLGGQDFTYFVGTEGTDLSAPIHGLSWDKPWKTIRYACEQIERGPRNPVTKRLLELNRVFIQREVTEWIQYQIDNADPGSIWENFEYEDYKCERDTGLIVDALMFDISHGGNVKVRGAASALVSALIDSPGTYSKLSAEKDQDIAAWNYMLTVIESVLAQEAPAENYQILNGDNSTAIVDQYFQSDITAEEGTFVTITSLVNIILDAIEEESADNLPARYSPNNLINVATGRYREVLPIIVPEQTCVLGAELRSTNAGPRTATTSIDDVKYSVESLGRLEAIVGDVILGNDVTETTGNFESQSADFPFADVLEETDVKRLVRTIQQNIDFRTGALALSFTTDPVGYNTSYLSGYGDARKLLKENKRFLQQEVKAWLASNYPNLKYSKTDCIRDVGYVIDAVVYDLTYDGNSQSVLAGLSYYEGVGSSLVINSSELTATVGAYNFLKSRMATVAANTGFTALNSVVPQYRDTAGSSSAISLIQNNMDDIVTIIQTGPSAVGTTVTLTDPTPADGVNSTTALISDYSTLDSNVSTIQSNTINFINNNFPTLDYNESKCSRDVETILKAVGFDFMLNSNFQTTKSGYAYLRGTASEVFELGQKAATRDALEFVRSEVVDLLSDSTAISRTNSLMQTLDDIIYSGSNEGSVCASELRNVDYAVLQLERNREFLVAEISAWIADTFVTTATATTASTDAITVSDTNWLQRNAAVRFTGSVFGGVVANKTYFVQKIIDSTTFTVAETRYATSALELTDAMGSMTVSLFYNSELCLRDVNEYINALKYDLKYPGNYRALLSARYYANSVVGSLEEDMFYLRDGTGLRDMTLEGLTGDLTPENEYGTSRVTAGAYASLDPGWGPDDFRAWIINRSPYVQGLTTLGTAAIGQKIDGALHNGGNDSIVSNDFTQVISDGIGAWVANNGRAELVSVFSYYAHIGYLSTEGGRIRGTNGNNSYGDFGSVAEGFDSTEVPNTAVVDNRFQFVATVRNVYTNGNQMLGFEFDNAGIDYTEASWTLTGGGLNANAVADEFRDDAVYQVRLLDFGDDSSGQFGGEGYLTNSNTAQGGTTSSLTIAATDDELGTSYVGMKLYLTGGTGAGQFGIVTTYNAGTKIATVIRERDGVAGWDHIVPGTTIITPDASTTYTFEPRVSFESPGFTAQKTTLSASQAWSDAVYGETTDIYIGVSGTYSGTAGAGATFDVTRNGWKYFVSLNAAGTDYTRLETITILGSSVGGIDGVNDILVTITSTNSVNGGILEFDDVGFGSGGVFVAVGGTSSTAGSYSADGETWTASTMPSGTWTAVAHGLIDDGSSIQKISKFAAVSSGGTTAAYSDNGIDWTATTLPTSANWSSVTFGNGRFIAVASDSTTVAISLDGEVWDITGTLNTTGFVSTTFGAGKFVAVKTGTTGAVEYSTDGGITWTQTDMPENIAWNGVAFGNNRFVAVATDSNNGAYSLDGITWNSMTVGSADGSSVSGYQKIKYAQGLFMTTAYLAASQDYSFVATSEFGLSWDIQGVDADAISGYSAVAFGNPQRTGTWIVLEKDSGNQSAKIRTGATAKGRAFVAEEKVFTISITEPGSGYDVAPTMTVTSSPAAIYDVPHQVRIGKGSLATPTFLNRGSQYSTGSAEIATGDGYADNYQPGGFVAVRRITQRPVPGSNIVFSNLPGRNFKLVNVITFLGENDGSYTAFFQVSPTLSVSEAPDHLDGATTRIRYSQVRLTGHDFLDIGTGSFEETNYPNTPVQDPIPSNETVSNNAGRVFFTATDQDGNFRVGDLFSIEQSTGVATLNADAFNISGLQELNLGNVTLGGGSATVTEFSTDPFFTADSDNVIPTQRAIKAYISAQIGGGGASLNVNSVTAGAIFVSSNVITTTGDQQIEMNANFDFRGGVNGLPLAFNYLFK